MRSLIYVTLLLGCISAYSSGYFIVKILIIINQHFLKSFILFEPFWFTTFAD